jgi:hypothetical protein
MASPYFDFMSPQESAPSNFVERPPLSPEEQALLEAINQNLGQVQSMKKSAMPKVVPKPNGTLAKESPEAAAQAPVMKVNAPISQEDEYRALRNKLMEATDQSFLDQRAGIAQREQSLKNLKSPGIANLLDVDLTPMLAYFDAGLGTNIAGQIRKPQSEEDRKKMIMQLEGEIQRDKAGMTQQEIANLKSMLDDSQERALLPYKKEMLKAQSSMYKGLSPGQKSADTAFGQDFQEWNAQGGYANVEKQLEQLERAADMLSTQAGLTGGNDSILPDEFRKRLNPTGFSVQQSVEQALQSSLRQTLGPAFTAKEGADVLKRAFDPALSGKENARRIRLELENIRKQALAKENASRHFQEFGTLKGLAPAKLNESSSGGGKSLSPTSKDESKGSPPPTSTMSFDQWKASRGKN